MQPAGYWLQADCPLLDVSIKSSNSVHFFIEFGCWGLGFILEYILK